MDGYGHNREEIIITVVPKRSNVTEAEHLSNDSRIRT